MSKILQSIASDIVGGVLVFGPPFLAFASAVYLCSYFDFSLLSLILFPISYIVCFLIFLFTGRLLIPRLKSGVYNIGLNFGFMSWFAHSMLARSAKVVGLNYLFNSNGVLRYLYLRALGVKISYGVNTSIELMVHDGPMIEIQEGVMLSEDVVVSGHLFRGDKVLVAPVRIGKGTFVGRNTYIGPRSRIGQNCWVGMNNTLTGKVLADGERVENSP